MKKLLLKLALFSVLMVVADILCGFAFYHLRGHAKGGSTANCEYIANKSIDDIVILGSSRATHHYIPQIIEDSLGVTCYNCGEEGNGIVLAYGRYKQLISRYKPKLIIYEVTPSYDYLDVEPNNRYLRYLRPYYDQEGVSELIDDFGGELISIKMLSRMYQNTSRLLPNIIDNIIYRDNRKGFSPLYGTFKPLANQTEIEENHPIDQKKLNYLEQLIIETQAEHVPLWFIVSPCYEDNSDISVYQPATSLCEKYNVPFLLFKDLEGIFDNPAFFQDRVHMNIDGAERYTSFICSLIKEFMKQ